LWIFDEQEEALLAYQSAMSRAYQVLEVNPNDPFTMMDLAWLHSMLGNLDEAEVLMDRARALAPEDPYTHYYDALVHYRRGDIDGAIAALEVAVDNGYPIALLAAEPHLASLHENSRFLNLIN
jgi:tetratricopeptide (TPR) repeat protein